MSLVSPGVEISVIDESQYAPTAVGTIPLLFIATAQDKQSRNGGIAEGTQAANANSMYVLTSQRDVITYFGNPLFYNNTNNVPLHGYELNEYGLLTAYSLLGITSRCYVIRADINLNELASLSGRPLDDPADMTYWLDLTPTRWGIFEWDSVNEEFDSVIPLVITNTDDIETGSVPKAKIGQVGDYALVTTNVANPLYYKDRSNNWVLVGSDDWKAAVPTITGAAVSPELNPNDAIEINTVVVTLTGDTVTDLANDINLAGIPGVTAAVIAGSLNIFADSTASSDGSTADGLVAISDYINSPLDSIGISEGSYATPALVQSKHTAIPAWRTTDPHPDGSIWIKTTSPNFGASIALKRFNSLTRTWQLLSVPLDANDQSVNSFYDPLRGGSGIPAGTAYAQYDVNLDGTATYKLFTRARTGATIVTGTKTAVTPTFTIGDEFEIWYSSPGETEMIGPDTVTMTGETVETFVEDVLARGLEYVGAMVNPDNTISIYHTNGGVLWLRDVTNTPLADANITEDSDYCRRLYPSTDPDDTFIVSNWVAPEYTASITAPGRNPPDRTKWYWGEVGEADIMIHDGSNWKGYRNVSIDARGFNLALTDPNGPIFSATEPSQQSDGTSLQYGDLWIDTSDLENYPKIFRWVVINSEDQWQEIDVTDQTTENGIIFADARFMGDAVSDVVVDDIPTIASLLNSNYLDIDAPNASLYPRGTLLFNTRRSSFNVKEFRRNYFNSEDFPGEILPTETNAWVSISGQRQNGHAFFGRKAQRNVIVSAMRAAIDTNTEIREEMREFNLIACPGYPELMPNMVQLNNDRKQTAFVVADSPFRIPTEGTALTNWLQNSELEGVDSENSLVTRDPYSAVWYPSILGNDLSGNLVALPPSYGVLRMIIKSDQQAFPWFAPAGTRRGVIDNAVRIGYLTEQGEFVSVGVRQGIRDILYENNVNPLTQNPVAGIIADGQKTRSSSYSALDRINVARLIVYMRTQLDKIVRPFLYEPNDKITRDEVKGVVDSFCNELVAKRGLYDYLVVCDESNNTPDRIDRNELYIDIAVEPVKAIEFIYIPIRIKNTGEIASGSVATSRAV